MKSSKRKLRPAAPAAAKIQSRIGVIYAELDRLAEQIVRAKQIMAVAAEEVLAIAQAIDAPTPFDEPPAGLATEWSGNGPVMDCTQPADK